jgi:predicted permease
MFDASLSIGDNARRDTGFFVSGSYFSVLGLRAALGRLLDTEDDGIDGQAESVVLSYAYWQRELASDPNVLGRKLTVNGVPLTIVGVAPRGFHGTTVGARANVFVPISFPRVDSPWAIPDHDNRGYSWVYLFARLAPGMQLEAATSAINPTYQAILSEIDVPLADGSDIPQGFATKSLVLEPGARGQSALLQPIGARLMTLFAVSGAVLLLCCANVAGLMLIRASTRTGEMAVRASMGASRRRLTSLLLAEALLLAVPAALLSLPIALLVLQGVSGGIPDLPGTAFDVELSATAALAAAAAAVGTALLFGVFPVHGITGAQPALALHAYGVRQTSGKRVTRFRAGLATAQVALSMALLALTGVFAQSLANIARIELGLDVESVATLTISPEGSGYTPAASTALFDRLEEELAAVPGVTFAASAMVPLLAGGELETGVFAEGNEQSIRVHMNYVSADFFRALDVGLIAGRNFGKADAAGAPSVVLVNQRLAERLPFGGAVIGQRIRVLGTAHEIVGLVPDLKSGNVTDAVEPQVFLPRRQAATLGTATFYVRGAPPPQHLLNTVRETVARAAPTVPIENLRTMRQQVTENLAEERFFAGTSTAFAVLATVLAGLGLYGVLAYSVAQRSREIALRFALGAPAARVRAMVLRQVGAMALIGMALGVIAAVLLGRAARGLLFGVEAAEPMAFVGAAVVLTAVMLGAAYIPARRASRVDPMVALRYE